MFKSLKVRISQGSQYIPDMRAAKPVGFRGLPIIEEKACATGCRACVDDCPTDAIALDPVRVDLGRCIFCSECANVCPEKKLRYSEDYKMAATRPWDLVVGAKGLTPLQVSGEMARRFGRSLKLRSVSAAGCNGCELELNAVGNVNFDLGRYGIEFVASPRHADALVLSGPISRNMADALQLAYDGMPAPKFVIAAGACAISGGPYAASTALDRSFLLRFKPSLYVPGCPPHPLTFVNGILDMLGIGT